MNEICRSFTLYNYNIPVQPNSSDSFPYLSFGFWNGFDTKTISNKNGELDGLWSNNELQVTSNTGCYSQFTIYGFSSDDWFLQQITDEQFWSSKMDENYPLIFIAYIQTGEYKKEIKDICVECASIIRRFIGSDNGCVYTYTTMDKNDLIICIKSKNFQKAIKSIQEVHKDINIIYSYTVFSISEEILKNIDKISFLKDDSEIIDSVSLRGVVNTYNIINKFDVRKKYFQYSMKLISMLYDRKAETASSKNNENNVDSIPDIQDNITDNNGAITQDYHLYDILGDNDFHLIARNVPLLNILKQMKSDGLLNIRNQEVQFYLFSLALSFNTITEECEDIPENIINETNKKMSEIFKVDKCKILETKLDELIKDANENTKTIIISVLQITKSLQAFEMAPITMYDFYSLYEPLKALTALLEEKKKENNLDKFCKDNRLHEIIHKMNITLHGTLKTDIQFFQFQNFNISVPYAPARLNAFYSLWLDYLSDFYNSFTDSENTYKYVFSPGFFPHVAVYPAIDDYESHYRLLVVTSPEKALYNLKRMLIVLSHEVPHAVGHKLRNRVRRHDIWIKIASRVFMLEYRHFVLNYFNQDQETQTCVSELLSKQTEFENEFANLIQKRSIKNPVPYPHGFHSKNSIAIIAKIFHDIYDNDCETLITRDVIKLFNSFALKKNIDNYYAPFGKFYEDARYLVEECKLLFGRYQNDCLKNVVLPIIKYIMAESFADLMAILTLHINPEDYLESFIEPEVLNKNDIHFLHVRIYHVICALESKVSKYESVSDFYNNWETGVITRLLDNHSDIDRNTSDHNFKQILNNVNLYKNSECDFEEDICKYAPIFLQTGEFANKRIDFLNDVVVRNLFQEYLQQCIESYYGGLNESFKVKNNEGRVIQLEKNLNEVRMELKTYYHNIKNNTALYHVQAIERFLNKYDEEKQKFA